MMTYFLITLLVPEDSERNEKVKMQKIRRFYREIITSSVFSVAENSSVN